MKSKLNTWLGAAAFSLLVLGLSTSTFAGDKAGAAGKWKWRLRAQRPDDGNHADAEAGWRETDRHGVRSNNTETAIEDAKLKDGEVSFKVTRERNGQNVHHGLQRQGERRHHQGTIETERDGQKNSRDWEAKRVKEEKK